MWRQKIMSGTRILARYLFWPALIFVGWGELTHSPPAFTAHFWDKSLHFTAYFGLAAMATLALGPRRILYWALLGLVALGGVLEIMQQLTGRDGDIFDELANTLGVLCGAGLACGFIRLLRPLVGAAPRD